ncbi:hypothetical protein BVRB_5g116370 [Beta vulgaris subsp. vulgaris]|nr:hypothetical protein BVRB_5g116370 [Beta vulgaris subsp. vulgaris]
MMALKEALIWTLQQNWKQVLLASYCKQAKVRLNTRVSAQKLTLLLRQIHAGSSQTNYQKLQFEQEKATEQETEWRNGQGRIRNAS